MHICVCVSTVGVKMTKSTGVCSTVLWGLNPTNLCQSARHRATVRLARTAIYICIHIHTYMYTHMCMCIYSYILLHICILVYVYTHICLQVHEMQAVMPPPASDSPPEPFARPRFQDLGPSRLAKVQTITSHGLLTQASEDTQERASRTGSVVSNLALAESRANVPCWGRWLLNVCPHSVNALACSLYAVVTTYRLCGIAILPQPLSLSVAKRGCEIRAHKYIRLCHLPITKN